MASFKEFFSSVFKGKSEAALGIDIGSSAIKVVQIRKKGARAALETYGELALGPYGGLEVGQTVKLPVEKIAEALRDVIKEAKVTTKLCGVSIPLSASLVSFIELPTDDERQLATMVPIEARKYIPVPINEVTLDWMLVPKIGAPQNSPGQSEPEKLDTSALGGRGKESGELFKAPPQSAPPATSDILIAAIHNKTLEQYRMLMAQLELDARFYEIETFSAVRAAIGHDVAPVMVFDMGATATKLYLVEQGAVRDSHIVNRGSHDITTMIAQSLGVTPAKAEMLKRGAGLDKKIGEKSISELIPTHVEYVFSEANRLLLYYQRRYNKVVKKVILCGGGVLLPGFRDIAQSHFGTDVVLADPFSKLDAPVVLNDMLKRAGPEFTVSIGAALRLLHETL